MVCLDDTSTCQQFVCREPHFPFFWLLFPSVVAVQVWFIEVNSNPCLELASPYLAHIIPRLLEHVMRLTVDVHFPAQVCTCATSGVRCLVELVPHCRAKVCFVCVPTIIGPVSSLAVPCWVDP